MRIFLSAVSAQFKECREGLASDLRAVGAEVVVQEDFQQQGRTLLEKLERYIASCDRVIALIGDAYGWEPDPVATPGLPQRSYSQWEYWFAQGERLATGRQLAINTYVYFASQAFLASHPVAQEAGAMLRQKSFVADVRRSGKDWSEFGSIDGLRILVLRDGFRMASGDHVQLSRVAAALRLVPRPPLVGFIPRSDRQGQDILGRLRQELDPARNQLVALWGPGGVGKTALAAQAAREWVAEFGSRLVWIGADQSSDFALDTLLDTTASQLGRADLIQAASKDKEKKVREMLAEAASLIVLDNFETVLPQNQGPCVSWLADSASCSALLTTRDSLSFKREGIDLALNIRVEAMTKEEARRFVERHAELADNPEALSRAGYDKVIQAADANPLILQWIVAQVSLAQAPDTVLDQLAHGKGGPVERIFDRSFNLPQLGDDGRATLLALSLFVSSASRLGLMDVAGFGGELERLNDAVRRLAGLRLLSAVGEADRLVLHGLSRDLARTRLAECPQVNDFRRRFVNAFLRCRLGPGGGVAVVDRHALDVEEPNLLGAIDVADEMADWESVVALAANAAGTQLEALVRIDRVGHRQPVSEREYRTIGRAALASLLEISDTRRIPLESDALWSELEEVGPANMGRVLRNPDASRPDYLAIVWWAEAMTQLADMLVELLSLKEAGSAENKTPEALSRLTRDVKNVVKYVRSLSKPLFGQDWVAVAMTRASQIQAPLSKP
jgi:hypothetical protein